MQTKLKFGHDLSKFNIDLSKSLREYVKAVTYLSSCYLHFLPESWECFDSTGIDTTLLLGAIVLIGMKYEL